MSRTGNGIGHLISRLVLSILLVFFLLGTVGSAFGVYLTASPSLLISQLEKQDAPQKAHDTLQTKFETAYNTTAVPAEVYMDVVTVDWMEDAMASWVKQHYELMHGAKLDPAIDYTALEASVTAYFEQFAEENNCEKDDTYTKKLEETIQNAENIVQNAVDVYHLQTMRKAGVWGKLQKFGAPLWIALFGCIALSVLCIVLLRRSRTCYWIGTSLFADGVLLTVPAAWVLGTSVIARFSLKEPAVYAVFTGTLTALTQMVLTVGIVMLAMGLALWIGSVLRNRSRT